MNIFLMILNYTLPVLSTELVIRVDELFEFPESGRVVPEKEDPAIRELIEGHYRIFYRLQKNSATILRIHHSSKSLK